MILPGTYQNGFAPRDGEPMFPELWRGCVGAWNPGLGPSGAVLRDWSPYKNHGTLTNMDPGTDWVASQGGYALDFDGVNDVVAISGRMPILTNGDISIAVTLNQRTRSVGSNSAVVDLVGSRSFVFQQALIGSDFYIYTDAVDVSNNISITTASEIPDLNTINHLVFSFRGINYQWWINGRLAKSGLVANRLGTPAAACNIMRRSSGATGFTDGILYDLSIYNRALSPSEIRLLASRRGIAYEMAPRGWTSQQIAAYRSKYYSQIVGGGVI